MPANNSNAHALDAEYPGRLGLLMSPGGCRNPKKLPYAYDNKMYTAFVKSGFSTDPLTQRSMWDHDEWRKGLDWCLSLSRLPIFAVVPDVVGNADATREQFRLWAPGFCRIGLTPAIAVQDGMTPDDVPDGVVCFVGGTTEWKWRNVKVFADNCEWTHVGRVNTYSKLWECHELGVSSCDGSGFFRGDQNQKRGLLAYLKESLTTDTKPNRQLQLYNK